MFRKVGVGMGSPRKASSVGVACCPDGLSLTACWRKRDQALYHAKKCGKNQFFFPRIYQIDKSLCLKIPERNASRIFYIENHSLGEWYSRQLPMRKNKTPTVIVGSGLATANYKTEEAVQNEVAETV